jgi:hypothetical protein
MDDLLTARAQKLTAHMLSQDNPSISYEPTLFDTALVAAIYRQNAQGTMDLVFPEALKYVLARQQADGGWTSGMENFQVGCILNTLAGLYALLRAQTHGPPSSRVSAAKTYLQSALQAWDPADSSASPRQLRLVSNLLARLKTFDVVFAFPREKKLDDLMQVGAHKKRTNNHVFAAIVPPKQGHNVEVQPHSLRDCGVNCSPAETALALVHAETYKDDYEVYLQSAMQATGVDGGVPAVFPMSLVDVATVSYLPTCRVISC